MEKSFTDVGHRVEPQAGGLSYGHAGSEERGTVGADLANGSAALQAALKKAAAAVGNGFQDGKQEVVAYARREPLSALTAAAGFGMLVGFVLAMGSRSGAGSGRAWLPQARSSWLPQLHSRRAGFLGTRTRSGWRGLLRAE